MDLPQINDKRGSGMKILPLLLKVLQCCQKKTEPSDSDNDCELRTSCTTNSGVGAAEGPGDLANEVTGRVPIDDDARWLDKKCGLHGRAIHAERQRLALAGVSDVDLSSPFFCDILDEASKS
jgi:hypothetical protein